MIAQNEHSEIKPGTSHHIYYLQLEKAASTSVNHTAQTNLHVHKLGPCRFPHCKPV